jgi:cell division protein FtsA
MGEQVHGTPKMKKASNKTRTRSGLIAALDVGSTKIACFIARPATDGKPPEVVGIGHHLSRGVRSGAIVDMEAAEASIRSTVEAAEQMAGENVRDVVVSVSGAHLASEMVAYEVSIAGHEIGEADLRRVLDPFRGQADRPHDREGIHSIPVGYAIDGTRGVRDPRGMYGERLGVNLHLVTAGAGPLRNLATCIGRCHLNVETRVAAPYASGLACLVEDETELGATLIDMGGGTTSIAVFFDGELIHADCIPVGGLHVTNDIARGLSTPLANAERMKTLYGSALPSPSDDREIIRVPQVGEEEDGEASQVPRSMLVGIIRPRLEETFEMVRARLEAAGFDKVAGRRAVLCGGASQLTGVRELAGMILDKQVRMGRPTRLANLAEAVAGPAFSTCAGLIGYALNRQAEALASGGRPLEEPSGPLGRIGTWLRENL